MMPLPANAPLALFFALVFLVWLRSANAQRLASSAYGGYLWCLGRARQTPTANDMEKACWPEKRATMSLEQTISLEQTMLLEQVEDFYRQRGSPQPGSGRIVLVVHT
ncbi:hypothetical protein G6O67_006128 [Ophiocordyceps sinensis]|uniref:Uncharacterized protein n=1 Tax=Ophiocordyceps sinensis TaxID=72228 RepID=A0A8H4LUT2_9HYPO|nr:hypothetical protein G6O67_006128 [Ophiocordyceps sinensis]